MNYKTREQVRRKIYERIVDTFQPDTLGEASHFEHDLHFDEIDWVELKFYIEEEFNFSEIIPDETDFATVGELVAYVCDRLGIRPEPTPLLDRMEALEAHVQEEHGKVKEETQ